MGARAGALGCLRESKAEGSGKLSKVYNEI